VQQVLEDDGVLVFNAPVDQGVVNSQMDKGVNTKPEGSTSNNIARGMRGGEGTSMGLRDLASSMQG